MGMRYQRFHSIFSFSLSLHFFNFFLSLFLSILFFIKGPDPLSISCTHFFQTWINSFHCLTFEPSKAKKKEREKEKMAAFSYQYQPFLLDSIFLPNNPLKMGGFFDDQNFNTNCFSQFYPQDQQQQQQPIYHFPDLSKQSPESSTLVDRSDSAEPPVGNQLKPAVTVTVTSPCTKKRKSRNNSSATSAQSKVRIKFQFLLFYFIFILLSIL